MTRRPQRGVFPRTAVAGRGRGRGRGARRRGSGGARRPGEPAPPIVGRLPFDDVLALIRATRRRRTETTTEIKERKFGAGRALMTGGPVLTKTVMFALKVMSRPDGNATSTEPTIDIVAHLLALWAARAQKTG